MLLIVVLIAVILWRGPKTLPVLGRSFGEAVRGARRAADDAFDRDRDPAAGRDDADGRPRPADADRAPTRDDVSPRR